MFCIMIPDVALDFRIPLRGSNSYPAHNIRLEYANRLAHRALDVQRLDVLPVLLQ